VGVDGGEQRLVAASSKRRDSVVDGQNLEGKKSAAPSAGAEKFPADGDGSQDVLEADGPQEPTDERRAEPAWVEEDHHAGADGRDAGAPASLSVTKPTPARLRIESWNATKQIGSTRPRERPGPRRCFRILRQARRERRLPCQGRRSVTERRQT
jgi:hypothetical protein